MDDVFAAIHRWMVGISLDLASRHPQSDGIYRAGPYLLELAIFEYLWLKMWWYLRGFRRSHTSAYVEQHGDIFKHPAGFYLQLTHDKRGKVDGAELADPPAPTTAFARQPAGFFKRQA